jgi:hypothetical protein
MDWQDIPETVDAWTLKIAASAYDLRQVVSTIYTESPVGYYRHPVQNLIGLFAPLADETDQALCKQAAERTGRHSFLLSYQELTDPDGQWVKVAYSPTLRRAGELLNFFPGQYPGDIPNHPSPIAAMLTSGLLGAGLGYGGGKLLSHILPDKFGDKLGRTGMILGGALGATPGALWGVNNRAIGRPFNDPTVLNVHPGQEALNYHDAINGANMVPRDRSPNGYAPLGHLIEQAHLGIRELNENPRLKRAVDALADIPLGKRYRLAMETFVKRAYPETFGDWPNAQAPTPMDVNINHLGQTLWEGGATPGLAATTMGAMYAAQQLPDPHSRPGWVTGNQLGQLSMNAAGDYLRGGLVGFAINQVIGTPYAASSYGLANAALGVIGSVMPKLFGQ